ncbi:Vacuolar protein sorting-associated protein 41 [Marasmius sp. AFHP31]|nr:Vacuolar protein sorting-associated protein 41 [Marasmius sp. AFHP31]
MSVAVGANGLNAADEKDLIEQHSAHEEDDSQDQRHDIQSDEKDQGQAEDITEVSGGGEDGDGDGESEGEEEDEEDEDDDEDDEDEEPALKYERIVGDLPTIFKKDSGSAIAMSKQYMVSRLE